MSQNKSLQFGLNSRGLRSKVSAFQDDSDSESSQTSQKGRQIVNRQLHREQVALQKRAAGSQGALNEDIFDYDNQYESFSSHHHQQQQQQQQEQQRLLQSQNNLHTNTAKRESRYISSLLHHAKLRQQERDIVTERKIAKEQAAEESKEEYRGKDRFVTNAFKRKLQEREEWIRNDEEQRRKEEREDVTKQVDGGTTLFTGFLNLQKNLAGTTGCVETENSVNTKVRNQECVQAKMESNLHHESIVKSHSNPSFRGSEVTPSSTHDPVPSFPSVSQDQVSDSVGIQRISRFTRVLAARKRYFDRIRHKQIL